jgi:hypothetical protein
MGIGLGGGCYLGEEAGRFYEPGNTHFYLGKAGKLRESSSLPKLIVLISGLKRKRISNLYYQTHSGITNITLQFLKCRRGPAFSYSQRQLKYGHIFFSFFSAVVFLPRNNENIDSG